ncbi:MAG: TrkH family potassium uptake protein [Bacteroidota bacterium]
MFDVLNLRIVAKVISRILFIIAASLLACAGIALLYGESTIPFLITVTISLVGAGILFPLGRQVDPEATLQRKDAYITVTFSWLLISLTGSLPYLISGAIPTFTDAFFESVSGFTTTGASILTNIEVLPKSILFWRSLTHWIGGIGIIVLVILVMPTLQIGGYHLFSLESSLQEKIQPKIKAVGLRLLIIYIGLTVTEIILLLLGKMNLFESVCHAFGTVATGGFSPKNTSIGGYSPYIQYVIMIFMVLAGTNFIIHYYLLKGEIKKIKKNEEFRFYLLIILTIGITITSVLILKMGKPWEEAFRESFFQVISIITCTGFATTDYMLWPQIGWLIILLSMFLGGSTGSTAGGIKMARHLVVLKNIKRSFRQMLRPNAIHRLTLNKQNINDETNNSILGFIILYFMIFTVGAMAILLMGADVGTSVSSVATCMAGIGPGIGAVGPANNFAFLPDVSKLILSFLMVVGRLEIYTVIELFTINFWRK